MRFVGKRAPEKSSLIFFGPLADIWKNIGHFLSQRVGINHRLVAAQRPHSRGLPREYAKLSRAARSFVKDRAARRYFPLRESTSNLGNQTTDDTSATASRIFARRTPETA